MNFIFLPNVQDEPRPWLARSVRLGARSVTAKVVGSSVWFGSVRKNIKCGTDLEVWKTVTILSRKDNRGLNTGIYKQIRIVENWVSELGKSSWNQELNTATFPTTKK